MARRRPQQIVQPVKMHHVVMANGTPAERKHARIQRHRAILPCRIEVNRLHIVTEHCPTPAAALGFDVKAVPPPKAEIGSQHRNLMPSLGEPRRERTHLEHRSAPFLKREIGLNHFQNAHVACCVGHET